MLLLKITDQKVDRAVEEVQAASNSTTSTNNSASATVAAAGSTMVNRAIQLLAQRYCTDCKTSFEDLSRIIQVKRFFV